MNPLELVHSLVILIRDPQTNSLIKCYRKWKKQSKPIENCMKIGATSRKRVCNNLLAYLLTMRMKRKWSYDKREKRGGGQEKGEFIIKEKATFQCFYFPSIFLSLSFCWISWFTVKWFMRALNAGYSGKIETKQLTVFNLHVWVFVDHEWSRAFNKKVVLVEVTFPQKFK